MKTKSKIKVGDRFISLYDSSPNVTKGDYYEVQEVIPANQRITSYCNFSYTYAIPTLSFVIRNANTFRSGWTSQITEYDLKDPKRFRHLRKVWTDRSLSDANMATAIFEYLEKRGLKANRKKGVQWVVGTPWVSIEGFEEDRDGGEA